MRRSAPGYLAAAAIVLGALAALAGSPRLDRNARLDVSRLAQIVEREEDHVTALELAAWIRDKREDLRIVDVRDSADFEAYHIPKAERIPLDRLVSSQFRKNQTVVLYSDGGAHAAQAWVFLRALGHEKVYFLRGGLYEWLDDVMNPSIAADATDSAKAAFEITSEVSRYFGGVPRVGEDVSSQPSLPVPASRQASGSAKAAVARVRGRGC
jgi:rhodanese-related sulfurtransferase